jgi:hypothetical protein
MSTTSRITLADPVMQIARRHATAAGLTIDQWITVLIHAADAPWPDEGMDDMGFPSPRIPTDDTVPKTA